MRLVSAILVLLVAIVSLSLGIALRTVWAGPDSVVKTVEIDHTAPAVLIPGETLTAYPGRQTITAIDESGSTEAGVVLVYGRSADVISWMRPARFTEVRHNSETGEIYAVPRAGAESRVPNPIGSDLWLEQYRETDAVSVSLTADTDISVAVFADGDRAAPGKIQMSWPLDNVSPVAGLLVAVGLIVMVIGFILMLFAVTDRRRRRGPKRRASLAPKRRAPRRREFRPTRSSPRSTRPRGLRSMAITPVLIGVVLAGCTPTAETAPEDVAEDTATPEAATPYPAVTEAQFDRILERVVNQVSLADKSLDDELLEPRVSEPTLGHRASQYDLRRWDDELGQILRVPAAPIRLLVPQQTDQWPRTVMAVVQDGPEIDAATIVVVLRQEQPRDNYQLSFATLLAPDVVLPAMPAPEIGTPRIARDSKLIDPNPEQTVLLYANLLREGENSRGGRAFDVLTDDLYQLVGPSGRSLRQESLGGDLELETTIVLTDDPVVALATADNGALVFGTMGEVETVRPVEDGATINATPSVRALTELPSSETGFVARYEMQIVWYVPPIGSEERARVVGYNYLLVDAAELEPETDTPEDA